MNKVKLLYLMAHTSTGGMPAFVLKRIQTLLEYTDTFEIYVAEYEYYGELFVVHRNKIKELIGDRFYSLAENKMRVMEIIRTEEIDIVHLDEMPELMNNDRLFKDLYRNDRKWRIVETCHNISFDPNISKVYHPDLYLFCTPYHEQTFADMKSMYNTIEYPIDNNLDLDQKFIAKAELGFEGNKKHIVNIGLWTKGKNQGEGIEIARKYPEMMFHFVGNQAGNFQDYWMPLMNDLPDNVKIWGERSDTDKFLLAADIFMFNSTWECNPLVIREAISYGLPIIARNLPQYVDMFTDYINPIDSDLNNLKCNYNVPTDNSSLNFALRHEETYKKILELPINEQKVTFILHFVNQPFFEIKGISDSDYRVEFYDRWDLVYSNTIKSNNWVKLNKQYFTNWTVKVYDGDEMVYADFLHLHSKRVYIAFESKSLGDTIAWMPYVEEFRKLHQCHVVCSTFWNHLFDYPEIEFVEPATEVHNIYALYRIGYFDDLDKLPNKPTSIPLQRVATDILGLDFKETRPVLAYKPEVPKMGRYATIATNSTAGCKFWTKEGWQAVINWLVENGYEVYNTSKEPNPFDNCTQITTPSLESKMDWIEGSKFFIGLSSGLTWLAWAMGKKVVMISNFTEEWNEFDCYRVSNPNVCNGCWNNPNFKFDPGDWLWCPVHKGTNKQFICHTSITPEMVIKQIKHAME
jgi:autotransporter strand-loop-strand O-heptosyltransferase